MIKHLVKLVINNCKKTNGPSHVFRNSQDLQQIHRRFCRAEKLIQNEADENKKPRQTGRQYDFSYIYKPILGEKTYSISEWKVIEQSLYEKYNRKISTQNFEGITAKVLCVYNNVDLFKSFVDYIKDTRKALSIFTLSQYLVFCSKNLQTFSVDNVLSLYEEIQTRADILDSYTTDCLVQSVCATHKWKDSLKLVADLKEYSELKQTTYEAIINAAFINKEPKIAWDYFNQLNSQGFVASCETLKTVCSHCKHILKSDVEKSKHDLFHLLKYVADQKICVSEEVSRCVVDYFER